LATKSTNKVVRNTVMMLRTCDRRSNEQLFLL